jgi:transcriptional regulator of acetoin/glycerol metabolism
VPPLRKRKEDIPHLIRYFCQKNNWNIPQTDDFYNRLKGYQWPGNIRELINMMERLHIMSSGKQVGQDILIDFIDSFMATQPSIPSSIDDVDLEAAEKKLKARERILRDLMLDALKKTKGNVTAAAKLLDIPRSTFYKKLQKFGV